MWSGWGDFGQIHLEIVKDKLAEEEKLDIENVIRQSKEEKSQIGVQMNQLLADLNAGVIEIEEYKAKLEEVAKSLISE